MSEPAPARRLLKRRLLLAAGLIVMVGGGIYSWYAQASSDEAQAWQAYETRHYALAIERFSAVLKKNPDRANAYTGRSWAHLARRDWQAALSDSAAAIKLDARAALAYHAHGDAEAALGDTEQALKDLDKAIDLGARTATVYGDRARVRYAATGEAEQPLADLAQAHRLDRTYAPAYSLEGLILLGLQQYDAAIDACNRALELDPREARALLYRGHARQAKGLLEVGADDIARAKELDPSLAKRDVGK